MFRGLEKRITFDKLTRSDSLHERSHRSYRQTILARPGMGYPIFMQTAMINSKKPSLIVIAGPTCVGKTGTAIALAAPIGGEIVSADAMQVYKRMNIGTAKPTRHEQEQVKHHMVDVVEPDEPFSAARFKAMAETVIDKLYQKGIPVFVVGGTGLYIRALTKGLFKAKGVNKWIRTKLKREADTFGIGMLYEQLQAVDPVAALKIHANDAYRIIRALEVYKSTDKPLSEHHREHGFSSAPYQLLKFGLYMDRNILYERINQRVEKMLAEGLLNEVKALLEQGYGPELKTMRSIGYRHMVDYLSGTLTWDNAVETLKRDTRRYAKRQFTWFRVDTEIEWMQPERIHEMSEKIDSFLTR